MLNVKSLAVLATIVVLVLSSVANAEGNGVRGLKKNGKKEVVDQTEDASFSRTIGHAKTKNNVSSTPRSTTKDVGYGPTKGNVASSKRSQTPVDNAPAPMGQVDNPASFEEASFEEESDPVSVEEELSNLEDTANPAKAPEESTSAPDEGEIVKTGNGRTSGRGRKRTKAGKAAKRNGKSRAREVDVLIDREATRAPSFTVSPSSAPSTAFSGTDSPSSEPTVFRRAISRDIPIIANAQTDTSTTAGASASTTVRASASTTARGSKSVKSSKLFV